VLSFMKTVKGKAILFLWASGQSHLHVYHETCDTLKVKNTLGKVCVVHHRPHHLQPGQRSDYMEHSSPYGTNSY
jgi:hypothetical protein